LLYSHNGNYPTTLPNRIRLSNGMVRTDSSTFTVDEIADAGYVAADNPPDITYPEVLDWVDNAWLVRQPNQSEQDALWITIRAECLRLLAESDYKVLKAYEAGTPVPADWVSFRQELRDIYNNVDNLNPYFIIWPDQPA